MPPQRTAVSSSGIAAAASRRAAVSLPYHVTATRRRIEPPYRCRRSCRSNAPPYRAAVSLPYHAVKRRHIKLPYHAAASRRRIEPLYRCCIIPARFYTILVYGPPRL